MKVRLVPKTEDGMDHVHRARRSGCMAARQRLPWAFVIALAALAGACGNEGDGKDGGGRREAPWLVEFRVEATDDLAGPVWNAEPSPNALADPGPRPGAVRPALLGTSLSSMVETSAEDPEIHLGPGVTGVGDVSAVLITTIRFAGRARTGLHRRVDLVAEPGAMPPFRMPPRLAIGLFSRPADLLDFLPWPDDLSWTMGENGRLEIAAGGETAVLSPGDSSAPFEALVEVACRRERLEPVPMDAMGEAAMPVRSWEDLGTVRFSSSVTVVFHGRLLPEEQR